MTKPETLTWLSEFQARFGELLRRPLARSSGTLRAETEAYPTALCAEVLPGPFTTERERLAVYHRQYWFRLFGVLQREYLLTARLVGMWWFNELAARYLSAHPPEHYDLQRVAPGFASFLKCVLADQERFATVPSGALCEAAEIDHALSRVFLAPASVPLAFTQLAQDDLSRMHLQQSPSVALLAEHWPLVELRRRAQRERETSQLTLPAPSPSAQHWVVLRKDHGHTFVRLPPLAYALYTLLGEHSVAEALGALENLCSLEERERLPGQVQTWLKNGLQAGFWMEST